MDEFDVYRNLRSSNYQNDVYYSVYNKKEFLKYFLIIFFAFLILPGILYFKEYSSLEGLKLDQVMVHFSENGRGIEKPIELPQQYRNFQNAIIENWYPFGLNNLDVLVKLHENQKNVADITFPKNANVYTIKTIRDAITKAANTSFPSFERKAYLKVHFENPVFGGWKVYISLIYLQFNRGFNESGLLFLILTFSILLSPIIIGFVVNQILKNKKEITLSENEYLICAENLNKPNAFSISAPFLFVVIMLLPLAPFLIGNIVSLLFIFAGLLCAASFSSSLVKENLCPTIITNKRIITADLFFREKYNLIKDINRINHTKDSIGRLGTYDLLEIVYWNNKKQKLWFKKEETAKEVENKIEKLLEISDNKGKIIQNEPKTVNNQASLIFDISRPPSIPIFKQSFGLLAVIVFTLAMTAYIIGSANEKLYIFMDKNKNKVVFTEYNVILNNARTVETTFDSIDNAKLITNYHSRGGNDYTLRVNLKPNSRVKGSLWDSYNEISYLQFQTNNPFGNIVAQYVDYINRFLSSGKYDKLDVAPEKNLLIPFMAKMLIGCLVFIIASLIVLLLYWYKNGYTSIYFDKNNRLLIVESKTKFKSSQNQYDLAKISYFKVKKFCWGAASAIFLKYEDDRVIKEIKISHNLMGGPNFVYYLEEIAEKLNNTLNSLSQKQNLSKNQKF